MLAINRKEIKYIREILYIEIDKSSFLLIERKVYIRIRGNKIKR